MVYLSIIWGILALMFLALGCIQWKMAGKSISHLQIGPPMGGAQAHILGIDFAKFVHNFDSHIDYYNKTFKCQSKTQAIGYWVASAAALFSLVVTVVS